MSSNRFIFIILGIIFLAVVILSSQRIAGTLRGWFGKYIPGTKTANVQIKVSPTPTPVTTSVTLNATPTPKQFVPVGKSTTSEQIPATGPESIVWLLLGGSFVSGFALRRKK